MKRLLFSIGLTGVVLMTACSNEESKDSTGEENAEDIEAVTETEVENTEEDAEKEKVLQERENLLMSNDSYNSEIFEGVSKFEIIDFIELDHTLDNPGGVNITINEIELALIEPDTEVIEVITGLQNTQLGTEGLDYIENNDIIGLMTLKVTADSQLEGDDHKVIEFENYRDGIVRAGENIIQNVRYTRFDLENVEEESRYIPVFLTKEEIEDITEFNMLYPNISSYEEEGFENKEEPLQSETIEFR